MLLQVESILCESVDYDGRWPLWGGPPSVSMGGPPQAQLVLHKLRFSCNDRAYSLELWMVKCKFGLGVRFLPHLKEAGLPFETCWLCFSPVQQSIRSHLGGSAGLELPPVYFLRTLVG